MTIQIRDPFTEAYEVARTVDLVSDGRDLRIEILRALKSPYPFIANYYERFDGVWREVDYDVGMITSATSEDDDLGDALSFLALALRAGKLDA